MRKKDNDEVELDLQEEAIAFVKFAKLVVNKRDQGIYRYYKKKGIHKKLDDIQLKKLVDKYLNSGQSNLFWSSFSFKTLVEFVKVKAKYIILMTNLLYYDILRITKWKRGCDDLPEEINPKKEEKSIKRTIKDSVFSDFFGIPEYLLKLYQTLHPEDKDVLVEDLQDVTIQNVLVDDIYNDLGFRVGDRLLILVEAQSTWSMNIIIRVLIYLATTYQKYINEHGLDIYSSPRITIPKPEMYVLYTGDRVTRPDEVTLSKEFFNGEELQLEVKVKMLYGTGEDDVISQYVAFTKVFDEQRKQYGRTRKAIEETIQICKDRNIMKEYFEKREKEVITMLETLYDEEQIMKNHDAAIRREEQDKGIRNLVDMCKKMQGSILDAVESVASGYDYKEKEAEALVKKYW